MAYLFTLALYEMMSHMNTHAAPDPHAVRWLCHGKAAQGRRCDGSSVVAGVSGGTRRVNRCDFRLFWCLVHWSGPGGRQLWGSKEVVAAAALLLLAQTLFIRSDKVRCIVNSPQINYCSGIIALAPGENSWLWNRSSMSHLKRLVTFYNNNIFQANISS